MKYGPSPYIIHLEDDPDKIGFTSDGVHPLNIFYEGKRVSVFYEAGAIVLDRLLLRPGENNRRRFTLGHEVGHILSARINGEPALASYDQIYDREQSYSFSQLKSRCTMEECQANTLAAALLMPRFMVLDTLKRFNGGRRLPVYGDNLFRKREKAVLSKMADALEVFYTALVIRLRGLGLLVRHDVSEYISNELGLGATS